MQFLTSFIKNLGYIVNEYKLIQDIRSEVCNIIEIEILTNSTSRHQEVFRDCCEVAFLTFLSHSINENWKVKLPIKKKERKITTCAKEEMTRSPASLKTNHPSECSTCQSARNDLMIGWNETTRRKESSRMKKKV